MFKCCNLNRVIKEYDVKVLKEYNGKDLATELIERLDIISFGEYDNYKNFSDTIITWCKEVTSICKKCPIYNHIKIKSRTLEKIILFSCSFQSVKSKHYALNLFLKTCLEIRKTYKHNILNINYEKFTSLNDLYLYHVRSKRRKQEYEPIDICCDSTIIHHYSIT